MPYQGEPPAAVKQSPARARGGAQRLSSLKQGVAAGATRPRNDKRWREENLVLQPLGVGLYLLAMTSGGGKRISTLALRLAFVYNACDFDKHITAC